MAHQIENMFYVGQTPWHGLGHHFINPPKTSEEILAKAGLDWEVESKPIFDSNGRIIDSHKQLIRSTDGEQLGIVGNRYEPMQNAGALNSIMPLIESGDCEVETAGSLDSGKKIWMLLSSGHVKDTTLSNGEKIYNYFLWSTSHDGSRANRFGKTSVRVVCANTLAMSDAQSAVSFKHTKNQKNVLDTLVSFANSANMENKRMEDSFNLLLSKKINHEQLETYIKQVMNLGDSTRATNILNEIIGKTTFGRGNSEVRGTWWSALNGITEYLSHDIGRNAENRYKSLWFGSNQGTLNKASALAIQLAAG